MNSHDVNAQLAFIPETFPTLVAGNRAALQLMALMELSEMYFQRAGIHEIFTTQLADVLSGLCLHSPHHLNVQGILLLVQMVAFQVS